MKKNLLKLRKLLTIAAVSLLSVGLHAQSAKIIGTTSGSMKLSGTSTMHNWCMNGVFQVDGDYKQTDGTKHLQTLNQLDFLLPVENLKSDKKKLDETAYKALKTETYKNIQFSMTSSTVRKIDENKYSINAIGDLTVAGVTKSIMMDVSWVINPDQTITCTGMHKLKMTDFQVKPPSFLGFMKAGDEIALDFSFQFKS